MVDYCEFAFAAQYITCISACDSACADILRCDAGLCISEAGIGVDSDYRKALVTRLLKSLILSAVAYRGKNYSRSSAVDSRLDEFVLTFDNISACRSRTFDAYAKLFACLLSALIDSIPVFRSCSLSYHGYRLFLFCRLAAASASQSH